MFCPKCGKEIPDQAAFCPKCGAPLQAAKNQPDPAPAQPTAVKNKLMLARSMASPDQKKADKVHICILLVNLILVGLWFGNILAISDGSAQLTSFLDFLFPLFRRNVFPITLAFGLLSPVISNIFLTRHMLKQDGKINGSILSWLYFIWTAGLYTFIITYSNIILEESQMWCGPAPLGWLYIACCVVLFALLVYLTVLHFKAAKERKAQRNPG